jgi:hypothetical protein
MELKEIMSVSGQSGLFKFVSQGRNGIIVESLSDKKRTFINASQKVSPLSDISIFTSEDEVSLKDVFKTIKQLDQGTPVPDPKASPDILKKFMETILPDYDRERVYVSDIKKLVAWYNELLKFNLLDFEEEAEQKEEAKADTAVDSENISKTGKEKTSVKKTTPKKNTVKS